MRELLDGYARWNKRQHGQLDAEEVEPVSSLPEVSEEDTTLLQEHMRGLYGVTE